MYIFLYFIVIISFISKSFSIIDFGNNLCLIQGIWIQGAKVDFSRNTREYKINLEKYTNKLETFIYTSYPVKKSDNNLSSRKLINNIEIANKTHDDDMEKSSDFTLDLTSELDVNYCNITLFMNKIEIIPQHPNFWLLDVNDISSINLKITSKNNIGKILDEYYIYIFNDKTKYSIFVDSVTVFNDNTPINIEPSFSPNIYRYKAIINNNINNNSKYIIILVKLLAKCNYDIFINDTQQQSIMVNTMEDVFQTAIKVTCIDGKNKTTSEEYYFHLINSTNKEITPPESIIPLNTGSPCLLEENDNAKAYNCYNITEPVSFVIKTKPSYLYAIKSKDTREIFSYTTPKLSEKSGMQLEIFNGDKKHTYDILLHNINENYVPFKHLSLYGKTIVLLFILTFIFSSFIPTLLQILLSRSYKGINYFSHLFNIIITYTLIEYIYQTRNSTHKTSSIIYNIYSLFIKIDSNDPWSFTTCANLIWSYTYYKMLFASIRFICSSINNFYNDAYPSDYIFMDYNSVSVGNLDWPLKTFISIPLFGACYTILYNVINTKEVLGDNLLINEVFDKTHIITSRIKIHSFTNSIKSIIFETNIPLTITTIIVLIEVLYTFYHYFNKCYSAVKHGYIIWRWSESEDRDSRKNGYWCDRFCNQLYTECNTSSKLFNFNYQNFCGLTKIFDFEKLKDMDYTLEHQYNKDSWNKYEDSGLIDLSLLSSHYRDPNDADVKPKPSQQDESIPLSIKINKLLHFSLLYRSFGIIKCGWIDILVDWKFAKNLHLQDINLSNFNLISKSTQLNGPLCNGEFKQVFNGIRVPYMFFEVFIIRCVLGILFGIIINKTNHSVQHIGLTISFILFCTLIKRIIVLWPYNKNKDNIVLLTCLLVETLLVGFLLLNLLGLKSISTLFLATLELVIHIGIILTFLHNLSFIYDFSSNNNSKLNSYCNCILSIEFPQTRGYCIAKAFSKVPIYSARITFDKNLLNESQTDKIYISPIVSGLPPVIAASSDDFLSLAKGGEEIQIPEIIIFFAGNDIYRLRRIIIYDTNREDFIISDILKTLPGYTVMADEINTKILQYYKTHVPHNSILSVILDVITD